MNSVHYIDMEATVLLACRTIMACRRHNCQHNDINFVWIKHIKLSFGKNYKGRNVGLIWACKFVSSLERIHFTYICYLCYFGKYCLGNWNIAFAWTNIYQIFSILLFCWYLMLADCWVKITPEKMQILLQWILLLHKSLIYFDHDNKNKQILIDMNSIIR